ncbi:glutathione peroxidase [Kordiimonas marina]|uniref:glutathione peroxidase n=1 Tax=Kordiimonas marina TaxID=2872312 RepID=UPI001FF6CE5B|nr:glutathione peroxidase [Kordiimonas marina]MCJ9429417.1 glutathione peroxidase [Kordiimonas marina]
MGLKSVLTAVVMVAASIGISSAASAAGEKTAYDFNLVSIDRKPLPMKSFEGKAVLIVNTASYCGYTPQFKGLEALWRAYRDKGLVVLGIPANDFGDQEPGSEKNIKNFCKVNFQVDFPMTKKMIVDGKEGTADIYNWLASKLGEDSRPKWNFYKYLVDRQGNPVAYFPSKVTPESPELLAAIDKALKD